MVVIVLNIFISLNYLLILNFLNSVAGVFKLLSLMISAQAGIAPKIKVDREPVKLN